MQQIRIVRGGSRPASLPAAVAGLVAAARAVDGVDALGEAPLLHLRDGAPQVTHLLVGSPLVGYAQVDETGAAELVVHPDHRRRGLGTALVRAAAGLAGPLDVWAHGDLPAARGLADALGARPVRELLVLATDLTSSRPAAAMPAGVRLRPFVPGRDDEAWLALNARAFAHHPEQGRLTLADLRARQGEPWFDPAGLLLAERNGVLVGTCWTKVVAGEGELYVVGVDPDAQGQGLGRALTAAGLQHLAGRDLRRAVLYVDGDNVAALRTYAAAGFVAEAIHVVYRLG